MDVGFDSTTYTTNETTGYANVCVAVTNPPFGGAILPFSVTILPGEGGYVKIMFIQFIGLLTSSTHVIASCAAP